MAYFKKKQMKANGKWYPVAVTIGRPVGTDTIAKKLADLSSLSTGRQETGRPLVPQHG